MKVSQILAFGGSWGYKVIMGPTEVFIWCIRGNIQKCHLNRTKVFRSPVLCGSHVSLCDVKPLEMVWFKACCFGVLGLGCIVPLR